jgi:hypothetical protein
MAHQEISLLNKKIKEKDESILIFEKEIKTLK